MSKASREKEQIKKNRVQENKQDMFRKEKKKNTTTIVKSNFVSSCSGKPIFV